MLSKGVIEAVSDIRKSSILLDLGNKEILINNLIFCHNLIKESENLLIMAINHSSGALRKYFERHLEEERHHAGWLSEDLASDGRDVNKIEPHPYAKTMTDRQYKLVKTDGVNLLGYMAVLEGFPMPLVHVDLLEHIHGKRLIRTLRMHAEEDIKHAEDLWNVIDEINDQLILDNAIRTACECVEVSKYLGNKNVHTTRA